MLGAVLVALTLAGRAEIADGQIVVRNPSPLGDPNLDEALAGLAAARTVPVAQWMAGSPAGFVTAYFERLEAAGVLRPETVWLLFIARRTGYRLADQGYFENLRAALRAAVTGTGPIEPGLAALAGLVHAGGIADLLPGRENAALRRVGRGHHLASLRRIVPGRRLLPLTPPSLTAEVRRHVPGRSPGGGVGSGRRRS